jgi:thymidylate synthase
MTTANEAWLSLLEQIINNGAIQSPRGLKTKEIIGCQTSFDMETPVVTIKNRQLGYRFLAAEAWWILRGSNRLDEIKPYSKMIEKFSDDGLTFKGAYGPKVMDQIPYVAETLIKDPSSRQAVMTIWRERPGPTKDVPCTVSAQWFIRYEGNVDRLHCVLNMRSSDAWLGVPYDWFNFSMISAFLIAYIQDAKVNADPLLKSCLPPLKLGEMFFNAGSQHLYEQHWEAAKNCIFDESTLFNYLPFDSAEWQHSPFDLIDHLKGLADRNEEFLRGEFLLELFDLGKDVNRDDAEGKPRGYK